MTDVLTRTAPFQGGAVTAQTVPNMTVAVAATNVLVANQAAPAVAAGNVTITAADTTQDRIDAIVVDSAGVKSVIAGTAADGANAQPPDTTGYALLSYVYVYSQAHPAYTGTITSDVVLDQRDFTVLDTPANTMAFTWDSASTAAADPGTGLFRFNNTTNYALITHIYVNYWSPTWPVVTGNYTKLLAWFQPVTLPYYLRVWSRKAPNKIMVFQVTAFTDSGAYADLTVTPVTQTVEDLGGVSSTPHLSTDAADTIFEFAGAVGSSAVSSVFTRTGAVVAVTGDYDGCLLGIRNLLNGTTSYTPTSGTGTMYVECQAGGAGSRTGSGTTAVGGSGAGAYSASKITAVNAGAHTVAIGAGGAAGANNGNDTSMTLAGGESGTAPLAKGGSTSGVAAASAGGGTGGAAASGTGDIKAAGGGGGPSFWYATGSIGIGGAGGSTFFGAGGEGVTSAVSSTPGGLYGGGAGGNSAATVSSAAGGNGLMRITEYT